MTTDEPKVKKSYFNKPTIEFIPLNPKEMAMADDSCVMGGQLSEE